MATKKVLELSARGKDKGGWRIRKGSTRSWGGCSKGGRGERTAIPRKKGSRRERQKGKPRNLEETGGLKKETPPKNFQKGKKSMELPIPSPREKRKQRKKFGFLLLRKEDSKSPCRWKKILGE